MTQQHSITPPQELRDKWLDEAPNTSVFDYLIDSAARWGSDQELEACCEYLVRCAQWEPEDVEELRTARRPKPPSLAEQGQRILVENGSTLDGRVELDPEDVVTINAALKRLQELENND